MKTADEAVREWLGHGDSRSIEEFLAGLPGDERERVLVRLGRMFEAIGTAKEDEIARMLESCGWGAMKRFAVTVFVEAEDPVNAVLVAGDIMLAPDSLAPGPNYGIRHGAGLLAALGDDVIQVREVMA